MTSTATTSGIGSPRRPTPNASPSIVAKVRDLGRPAASIHATRAGLSRLPGDLSLLGGVGNTLGWLHNGVEHLQRRHARFGPVHATRFGAHSMVWVMDPHEVLRIAKNEHGLWSAALAWRTWFDGVSPTPTFDLPTALDFGPHSDARRLLGPAFSGAALSSYQRMAHEAFTEAIDDWLWRGEACFKPEVRRVFAGLAGRIFLGSSDPAEAEFLDRGMFDFWASVQALARNGLSPSFRRSRRAVHRLAATFEARVAERRAAGGEDLFSRICQASGGVDWVDDRALVQLFIGIMAAAFDTTSQAVISMGYLLATHPDWQARLREEGQPFAPGSLTRADLKQLPLHEQVWLETLRLMPVAGGLPRMPLCDVEVLGQTIPAGTFVLATFAQSHRDPTYWSAPDVFDPDRFGPDRAEHETLGPAFIPWGAGPHVCIGAQLSTLEALSFWHALLSRTRIRLARPYEARHVFAPLGTVSGNVELVFEPA